MEDFKNKLYQFEAAPPAGIWNQIEEELKNGKSVRSQRNRKHKLIFYAVAAAASVVIIFLGSVFFNRNAKPEFTTKDQTNQPNMLLAQKTVDSERLNWQVLNSIINSPEEKKEIIVNEANRNTPDRKYLTVAGPEGQPVKISPKVATLIVSADNGYPPKPVWSPEIREWQQIMLSSTISPTSANFADLVQLAANKQSKDND